jgi:hypothetical protein
MRPARSISPRWRSIRQALRRRAIAHDVPVKIGQHHHVKALWICDKLHTAVVDDDFIVLNLRILLRHLPAAVQKKPVASFHDIRLVDGGDFAAILRGSVVEGELCNSNRGGACNDLERLDDPGHHLMLKSGVFALGVFADHHNVHVVVACLQTCDASAGPKVRVELKCFSQSKVERDVARSDRRGERTFESDVVLADRSERLVGYELSAGLNRLGAHNLPLPFDWGFGSFKDLDNSVGDLRTDPIAWNKANGVCFHFLILEQRGLALDFEGNRLRCHYCFLFSVALFEHLICSLLLRDSSVGFRSRTDRK